ncbi:hypothetical protein [Methylosinus sp. PW1]|uniref:hypothetical protein n=1 Tax=Methylosinus sp. PW1 TaxID=107636 RepID=UPI0018DB1A5E|nr:hypothetical protein [Methylosinus sp. PW1]
MTDSAARCNLAAQGELALMTSMDQFDLRTQSINLSISFGFSSLPIRFAHSPIAGPHLPPADRPSIEL